jgi:hypothetical protein
VGNGKAIQNTRVGLKISSKTHQLKDNVTKTSLNLLSNKQSHLQSGKDTESHFSNSVTTTHSLQLNQTRRDQSTGLFIDLFPRLWTRYI